MPRIAIRHLESPSDHNPLGIKGVGEPGVVPATAAVAAAVAAAIEDALRRYRIRISEMPVKPQDLARRIDAARIAGRSAG